MTFFEITVVFTVIAILVFIIFLSTRRFIVETQLTRVREEHRVISRALQNYYLDNAEFPAEIQGLHPLSEPITYLAAIPNDLFSREKENAPDYTYHTWTESGQRIWLLVSCGPDGDADYDAAWEEPEGTLNASSVAPNGEPLVFPLSNAQLIQMSYDPTNGLSSDGDVFTVSPQRAR